MVCGKTRSISSFSENRCKAAETNAAQSSNGPEFPSCATLSIIRKQCGAITNETKTSDIALASAHRTAGAVAGVRWLRRAIELAVRGELRRDVVDDDRKLRAAESDHRGKHAANYSRLKRDDHRTSTYRRIGSQPGL